MVLFLTHWAAFSCASTGIIGSTAWKQEGITDWAPWTGSAWHVRQGSVPAASTALVCRARGWGSLCLWQVLAQPTKSHWKACTKRALCLCCAGLVSQDCVEEPLWTGKQNWLINPRQWDWWQHSLSMFFCGSSHRVARQALLCTGVRGDNFEYSLFFFFFSPHVLNSEVASLVCKSG